MTPQEAFNKAYIGVIQQGGPSYKRSGACLYRGQDGRKCGVGHLVEDENTALSWDRQNLGIHAAMQEDAAPAWMRMQPMAQLLTAIQSNHDVIVQELHDDITGIVNDAKFLDQFKHRMANVAKRFTLTIPQLETTE